MKSLPLRPGDVVIINSNPFIVARVSILEWQLIHLKTGNRWSKPVIKKSETITLNDLISDWDAVRTYSVILNPIIEVKEANK